jgi:hypothetical protein
MVVMAEQVLCGCVGVIAVPKSYIEAVCFVTGKQGVVDVRDMRGVGKKGG